MNVAAWADQNLERFGDYRALVDGEGPLSSAELHRASSCLAGWLRQRGLEPGQKVLICFPNGRDLVLAFTAVLRAGAVCVVVSPRTPAAEIDALATHWSLGNQAGANLDSAALRRASREGPPLEQPEERGPGDLAQVVYTSGTTGRAKGVDWTHGMVAERYLPFRDNRPATAPARKNLAVLPMSSAFGTQYLYLRLLQKMELHCLAQFKPEQVLTHINEAEIQTAMLVPSMCEALLGAVTTGRALPSLKSVLVGGSQVSPSLVLRFRKTFGVRLTTVYGTTELGPVTQSEPGQTEGVVGRVRDGLELRIVAAEGDEAGVGEVGEIQVRPQGGEWLATGDLGSLDDSARLTVQGRLSDRIIQGGHNVDPARVREVILACPGVRDCAVVGVPEPLLGEEVVAWIVGGVPERVARWCEQRLEPGLRPTRILVRDALPRNELGKVERESLKCEARTHRTELSSSELRQLIEEEGRFTAGSSEHGFLERGLDSVALVGFAHRLSERLGRDIKATTLFRYPTTDALTEYLSSPRPRQDPQGVKQDLTLEPIAIIGMAVRLPGVETIDEFWQALLERRDFSSPIQRWRLPSSCPQRATLFHPPYQPDGRFFGLTEAQVQALEPTHGLALELSWQAIEAAGTAAPSLPRCGLFLGLSAGEVTPGHPLAVPAMAVGRICHLLNLRGPAMTIDTTCSSGLVAVHSAVNALRLGQCEVALAGGVHLLAGRESFLGLAKLGVLAPDGRCKSFDASADGFGRGEGGAMVLLKPLSHALRDGDPIQAVIRGIAINHDGRSSSLTAPNAESQRTVMEEAFAAIQGQTALAYLEAHGTGTTLGDPIEVETAVELLGERRFILGSVKANVGHLEAAAGALGLVKAALVAKSGRVPGQPNFSQLNPRLESLGSRFVVPMEERPIGEGSVGVMSMGMSGTNAFALLEAPPERAQKDSTGPYLLCLSAADESSLEALRGSYDEALSQSDPGAVCFTAATGRVHQKQRLVAVGRDREQLRRALRTGQGVAASSTSRVAFLFTGQGVPWQGAGAELLLREPEFRRSMNRCDAVLKEQGVVPFVKRLESGASIPADQVQALLLCLEWSLFELWERWGIRPDLVAGHSLGEIVAATVAGVFSLETALNLVLERGRLMSLTAPGGLVAVSADPEQAMELAQGLDLEVSAINKGDSTVLGGPCDALGKLLERAEKESLKARLLPVEQAFHTSTMDAITEPFARYLRGLTLGSPKLPLVSGLTGEISPEEMSEPDYWVRHLREAVRFDRVLSTLSRERISVLVEIGPHPALLPLARDMARCSVPSLRQGEAERLTLLQGLGRIYQAGPVPNWDGVFEPQARLNLPVTPFRRTEGKKPVRLTLEQVIEHTLGLDVSSLDPDHNLLELGLDSLRILEFVQAYKAHIKEDFSVARFGSAPTLHLLRAGSVRAEGLRSLRPQAPGIPTVAFPPAGGGLAGLLGLAGRMDGPFHIFAFDNPQESLEQALSRFQEALPRVDSGGWRFLGWSAGAWLAFLAARAWEQKGGSVESVVMLDPPAPGRVPEEWALESSLSFLLEQAREKLEPQQGRRKLLELGAEQWSFDGLLESGLVARQDESSFKEHQDLYRYHLSLVPKEFPPALKAPLEIVWAGRDSRTSWNSLSDSGVSQKVVDCDHYTLIRQWVPD